MNEASPRAHIEALAALERESSFPFRSVALANVLILLGTVVALWLTFLLWNARATFDDVRMPLFLWAFVFVFWFLLTFGVALPMRAPSAIDLLARDARPPVLFLRSFVDDVHRTMDRPREEELSILPMLMQRADDASQALIPPGVRRALEAIDRVLSFDHWSVQKKTVASKVRARPEQQLHRAMSAIGPFVAVGRPGERLPTMGATRLYVPHAHWKRVVWRLTSASRLVIVQVGATPGAVWELWQTVRRLDPRRVLLLVPDYTARPLGYLKARELTTGVLPVSLPEEAEGAIVLFDARWNPTVLPLDEQQLVQRVQQQLARLREPPSLEEAWAEEPQETDAAATSAELRHAVSDVSAVAPAAAAAARINRPVTAERRSSEPRQYGAAFQRVVARGAWRRHLPRWVLAGSLTLITTTVVARQGVSPSFYASLWVSLFLAAGILGWVEHRWAAYLLGMAAATVIASEPGAVWPLITVSVLVVAAALHRMRVMRHIRHQLPTTQMARALGGGARDDATAAAIAADMLHATSPAPSLWFGHEWFLIEENGLTPVRFDDVLWLYPLRRRRKLLVIPLANAWYVVVHTRAREEHGIQLSKRYQDAVVDAFRSAAPHAAFGMNARILDAWNHDFDEFVRAIDAAMDPRVYAGND